MTGMDRETFAALFRDHVDRVTGFAVTRLSSPDEVADLVAATFLVALERSDSYDPARGEPAAWLLGIAANLLANQRRRAAREQQHRPVGLVPHTVGLSGFTRSRKTVK